MGREALGKDWRGKPGYCSPPPLPSLGDGCSPFTAPALPPFGPPAVFPGPGRWLLDPSLGTSFPPSTPLSQGVGLPSSCI